MNKQTLTRIGALLLFLTALLFALGAILLVAQPNEGFGTLASALLYYLGFIAAVPAMTALYLVQWQAAGRVGFAGTLLAVIGAVMYSAPEFALVAGLQGAAGWHDVWMVAMSRIPILLIGPPAFLLGMILLGTSTARARILPRYGGMLMAIGAFFWLVAFFLSVVPLLLVAGNIISGVGMVWLALALWSEETVTAAIQPRPAL